MFGPTKAWFWMILAALAQMGRADIKADYAARLKKLDRIQINYQFSFCRAPYNLNPFDRSTWILKDSPYFKIDCVVQILRPNLSLVMRGYPGEIDTRSYSLIDGAITRKTLQGDQLWHIYRDRQHKTLAGPMPYLTPVEIFHTFDLQEDIAGILEHGTFDIESDTGDLTTLSGTYVSPPGANWRMNITLDRNRGLLPIELTAQLRHGSEEVEWKMKTLRDFSIAGNRAIGEAVIALHNSKVMESYWSIYHYEVLTANAMPMLSKGDLEIAIPAAGVNILDEVGLYSKVVDKNGKVIQSTNWTKEQREADLKGLKEAESLRDEASARMQSRRTQFIAIIVVAVALTACLLGAWFWKRSSQLPT